MQENISQVILFQIDKTSKMAKQHAQRIFDELGIEITVEQWILLKIIHENEEISQKELASKSLRDPASITRTLDLLQRKTLVERKTIPDNRRKYHVALTSSGKKFIERHMPLVERLRKQSTDGLSKAEMKQLNKLLTKIQSNVQ